MTEPDLPASVARAIDAVNAGDTDAFLWEFVADGFNGFSRFTFELEGEMLLSMTITA